jgi:hypothetical protein
LYLANQDKSSRDIPQTARSSSAGRWDCLNLDRGMRTSRFAGGHDDLDAKENEQYEERRPTKR